MEEALKTVTPYAVGIIISIIVWYLNLQEKRINARQAEEVRLAGKIQDLEIKQAKSETAIEHLKASQSQQVADLKDFIAEKMDGIVKLFEEKIKNSK